MLFFIVLVAFIISIAWEYHNVKENYGNHICPTIVLILFSITICVCLFALIGTYISVDAYVESCNARYDMLTYQWENQLYENDNDIGKYQLVEKIQDWNEDLAYRKEIQDDFWVGIFYPNIYDQFEFIKL